MSSLGFTITLTRGSHESYEDGVCVMELASWLAGEPFSDEPACVSPVIGAFLRVWNDSLDEEPRNRLLQPYAARVIGTTTTDEDENTRAWLATDWLVRTFAPAWLDRAGLDDHAQQLRALKAISSSGRAKKALPIITAAGDAAWSATRGAAWDLARYAAGDAAGDAAREAGAAARYAAGDAAWDAAGEAGDAAWDAGRYAARYVARDAAEDAAWASAGDAAEDAARASAMDAARDAAGGAAGDAGRYAARHAAGNAAREAGTAAWDVMRDPAWASAGAAAREAAWDAAREAARDAAGGGLQGTVAELQASALLLLDRMIAVGQEEA